MKVITATIKPTDWDAAHAALSALGIDDIDYTEVQVLGRNAGRAQLYRGAQFLVDHVPQIRIDVTADDNMVARVIETIALVKGVADHGQYAVQHLVRQGEIG
jgi:nitrogen regulatory protein P-II 1